VAKKGKRVRLRIAKSSISNRRLSFQIEPLKGAVPPSKFLIVALFLSVAIRSGPVPAASDDHHGDVTARLFFPFGRPLRAPEKSFGALRLEPMPMNRPVRDNCGVARILGPPPYWITRRAYENNHIVRTSNVDRQEEYRINRLRRIDGKTESEPTCAQARGGATANG